MADRVAEKLPLRHPAENPMFILMVVLNFAILAVLIDFLASAALIPPALRGTIGRRRSVQSRPRYCWWPRR